MPIEPIPSTGLALPELRCFDDTMRSYMQQQKIPGGALAIVQEGRLIYARGYGYADREQQTPVQPTTLFRLASVSKPVTSVAVMTLVQNPRYALDLDAKAFRLLGLEPFLAGGRSIDPRVWNITVRQLLQHSGGWDRDKSGDIMFKHFEIAKDMNIASPPDHASLIRWAMGQPLDFDPGTKTAYSNFGYCVLGRVIEKVTGLPYEKYVQQAVLAPMGIRAMRIGKGRRSERFPNEACYYDPQNATARSVFADEAMPIPLPYAFASPETMDAHGGWIASAVDMAHFASALDVPPSAHPVLTPQSAALMYARPAPSLALEPDGTPSPAYYAQGWMVRPVGSEGKANYWHGGGMPGTSTLLVRLANGRSWVVLFNAGANGDIDGLLHQAAAKVTEWPTRNLFAGSR